MERVVVVVVLVVLAVVVVAVAVRRRPRTQRPRGYRDSRSGSQYMGLLHCDLGVSLVCGVAKGCASCVATCCYTL